MSKLNDVLAEAKDKLLELNADPVNLTGKVVIVYDVDDLFDAVKAVKSYPVVGVVYEGMRSQSEEGSTVKVGVSAEIIIAIVLLEQDLANFATDQKRTRAIDYLEAIRGQFMNETSTATRHKWHFMVEAQAEIKAGMAAWIQRWALPVQLPPKRR